MTPLELAQIQAEVEKVLIDASTYTLQKRGNAVVSQKGEGGDVVTEVDVYLEHFITEKLNKIFKTSIFGEELGGNLDDTYVWTIDPIDGTKHFVTDMPLFYTQVALLYKNKPILGVIYEPVLKHLFSASKGNGAYFNHKKISGVKEKTANKSVIDVDFGGKEDIDWKMRVVSSIAKECYRIRLSGARFSPYLLTGGIDAFVVLNPTTKIVDQAPRKILFEEAGFTVTEFAHNDNTVIVACRQTLSAKISEIIVNQNT